MLELTEKQKRVLNAIKGFIDANDYPPTRSEMAKILNYRSANTIELFLKSLQEKGYIKVLKGTARGIIINKEV
ncbi:hypothetical protein A9G41_12995 [Gilliamella sp. Nev5-1]|uniref:LexA family protein n=1 Tax=unclassified Gilliamella TaxID=2685620 RepID=UPI00080EB179|nr:hypothetical protein [Gilliamella apicola]OCG60779.1 hypothetical protein A9G40_02920 [Gilliamella apicola]OCG66304.1 hypothetical protein A9G41_12995 [Gilliamella apicola]